MRRHLAIAFTTTLLYCYATAQDITTTGNWAAEFDGTDLIAGPGSDVIGTYTSDQGVVTIEVTASTGWTIEVRRGDTVWHSSLTLSVRRVSDGLGDGTVTGGTEFQPVGVLDAAFFSGSESKSGIELQFRLEGVSVTIPPDAYGTDITFIVTTN